MKKKGKQIYLTKKEALALLPSKENIHTFVNSNIALIGADWSRKAIEDLIAESKERQIGGGMCMNMGHGLVITRPENNRPLFVEHDKEVMKKYA